MSNLVVMLLMLVLMQDMGCLPSSPARPLLLAVFAWVAKPNRHPVLGAAARLVKKGIWR